SRGKTRLGNSSSLPTAPRRRTVPEKPTTAPLTRDPLPETRMKRREFLKRTAATALASSVGPAILNASDKAGTKNPIIGQGEHRYECLHGWGQLPDHLRWQTTHGVCIDEAGLIYIKHLGYGEQALDTVVVFDPDGKFVRSF